MTGSYKDITLERHNIRFTVLRKQACGFTHVSFKTNDFKLVYLFPFDMVVVSLYRLYAPLLNNVLAYCVN